MRAIPLIFDENGSRFGVDAPVLRDFNTTVQNVMVNLGTRQGSDPVFADRGTYLQLDGAQGRMVSGVLATHAANFAALDTLLFAQNTELPTEINTIQKVRLDVVGVGLQLLQLAVQVTSSQGEIVGRLFTV